MTRLRLLVAALLPALVYACEPAGGNGAEPIGPGPAGTGGNAGRGGGSGAGGYAGAGGSGGGAPATPDAGSMVDALPPSAPDAQPVSAACQAAAPNSLLCNPLRSMPKSIKETGFFPALPDLTVHPTAMREYVPRPELWSDGMAKQRFLVLPDGKKIDNSNAKKWSFPIGTIFIKHFFDDGGVGGKSRPIETRFIRKAKGDGMAGEYEFYVYEWKPDGSDAALLVNDLEGDILADKSTMITIRRMESGQMFTVNNGQPFPHVVPSRDACGSCHEENSKVAQTFIGFDELRLNSKFTTASTKTQLQAFHDDGIFTDGLPASPATITDNTNDSGRFLRIKQFIFGNCVHCHHGEGLVDFRPDVFYANTVGQPTEAQSVVPPRGWLRVVPRMPEISVLYKQVERTRLPPATGGGERDRLRPMPPVGVSDQAVDLRALTDLREWILSLPPR
jgi:hypothetical protein